MFITSFESFLYFFLIKIFSSFTSSLSVRYSCIHFWNGLFFWFSYFLIYLSHLSLLILFYFILSWVIFLMPLTSFWHGALSITYPLEEGVIQGSFCRLKNSFIFSCAHMGLKNMISCLLRISCISSLPLLLLFSLVPCFLVFDFILAALSLVRDSVLEGTLAGQCQEFSGQDCSMAFVLSHHGSLTRTYATVGRLHSRFHCFFTL